MTTINWIQMASLVAGIGPSKSRWANLTYIGRCPICSTITEFKSAYGFCCGPSCAIAMGI